MSESSGTNVEHSKVTETVTIVTTQNGSEHTATTTRTVEYFA